MENPCLTFVTPTLLAGDRSLTNVIAAPCTATTAAHEIAHSWTGNLVTNSTWEHFWLNEGFTVLLERKIMRKLHGEPTFQVRTCASCTARKVMHKRDASCTSCLVRAFQGRTCKMHSAKDHAQVARHVTSCPSCSVGLSFKREHVRRVVRRCTGALFHASNGSVFLSEDIARFGENHPYTRLVPDLSGGTDPDDVYNTQNGASKAPAFGKGILFGVQNMT
eukprot:1159484-Pelagomonas_calceolata.AAC.4